MKSFVFASDLHGDQQDPHAVAKLYDFCEIFKPQVKVFGGDLFDFRNIRSNAGAGEKGASMAADVEAGLEFLKRFKPNVWLLGNHDKRLWDVAEYDRFGIVQDYAKQGIKDIVARCRVIKCKIIPYAADKGFFDLGKVRMLHGYTSGLYATKKHAEIYSPEGGIVLHGHTHTVQHFVIQRANGGQGRAVGCLANLDMGYNKAQPARIAHGHGFAYGYADAKGFEVYQAKPTKGDKWRIIEKTREI